MTQILITMLLAILLDRLVPDRSGYQLWTWYNDWAESIEQRFNAGTRSQGISAVFLAIVPIVVVVFLASYLLGEMAWLLKFIFEILVLYMCVDLYRLGNTAQAVSTALENGDLSEAAAQYKELTGKNLVGQSESNLAHATVEAVLKKANSLVIAPLFWFILLGGVGAILVRMAAILDQLWGHRSERFAAFGWAAARLDDLLGWVPARITALSYAVMGSFEDALHCWRRQAGIWSDINSGPILASGLGAMHLGSCDDNEEEDAYGNRTVSAPVLADAGHVRRVVALVWRVLLFWFAVALLMSGAHLMGGLTR